MICWQSLPEKFLERLQSIVPQEKYETVVQSFCNSKPVILRINTIKNDKNKVLETLSVAGITTEDISWYTNALLITKGTKQQITELDLYKNGGIFIQNISSMLPPLILDPHPGEKILDIAAAPGSKTTHIAQLMQNTGEVIANDISKKRLYKLRTITTQLGVTNVKITQIPGEFIWRKYPNYFDRVLIDAPCSMEGRFRADDEDTYKDWSPKKIKVLSYLQKRILKSAFYATKPGGIIVYSTCTLSPEENEEIINSLLLDENEHVKVESISHNYPSGKPILKWKNNIFNKDISKTLRILPSNTMEGFYVAKLRRIT